MEAPLKALLPDLPEGEILTLEQWGTFFAIADVIIASIDDIPSQRDEAEKQVNSWKSPSASPEVVTKYLQQNASSTPGFKRAIERTLGQHVPQDKAKGLKLAMTALNTRAGCLLLTGSTTPFHLQPFQVRHGIVSGWRTSYLPPLRDIHKNMALLCIKAWSGASDLLTEVIGLPTFPPNEKRESGFDFEFVDFSADDSEATLDFDAVIVGSGCGGGVCAKNLSEAGLRVLVVDKGYHYSTQHFPMDVADGAENLYENGMAVFADDGSLATIAGSCFGGGGLVNWSASFHTQAFVREEWAKQGLPFFQSQEYQACLDRVATRMGASTAHVNHSSGNRCLLEGARRLGYTGASVPQNTGNRAHDCGYCSFGCASACKQGPAVSFLPDAAAAGAQFMQGFTVDKVVFDKQGKTQKATGVRGIWTSRDRSITRKVHISAKKVIISAGTLNSPLVLLRSGLSNSQIGRNLHLHPVIAVWARFDEETRPWEGAILTGVVRDFENQDGHGHGVKLETPSMMKTTLPVLEPWKSAIDFKLAASSFNHWNSIIVLCRDRDGGRVYPDPADGRLRMQYTTSAFDVKHILEGVIASCRIMYVMGAREIGAPTGLQKNWVRMNEPKTENGEKDTNDVSFEKWLEEVRKVGLTVPYPATMISAHQMGTCRMSSNSREGVVNSRGEVWGTEDLFVSDASVFPSASGVNPMLTTMGISEWISRGIVRDWKKERT